jgi:hypothetical protein
MIMTSAVEARIHAVAPESIAIFHLFYLICIGNGNTFDILDQIAFAIPNQSPENQFPIPMPDGKSGNQNRGCGVILRTSSIISYGLLEGNCIPMFKNLTTDAFFGGQTDAINNFKEKKKISGTLTVLADIQTDILFIFGDSHADSPVYNKPD